MKNILIVGGSKGIGEQVLSEMILENHIINLSRSLPKISNRSNIESLNS